MTDSSPGRVRGWPKCKDRLGWSPNQGPRLPGDQEGAGLVWEQRFCGKVAAVWGIGLS